jgi:flagellar operon protein
MQVFQNHIPIIGKPTIQPLNPKKTHTSQTAENHFHQILTKEIDQKQAVQFSKHAVMRLAARDIHLSHDQLHRIEEGIEKAREKGIRDSLVLVDDVALVINVKNKMVITAMDPCQEKQNIFTNIDGAVIV